MHDVETLIEAEWVVPVVPAGVELSGHAVVVQDGRIVDVCPTALADTRYRPARRLRLAGHALLPGLINAHGHAAMTLMRGMADDLPLMTWLNEHIWPAEARVMSEAFVFDGTRLAIAEMLRGGTTCFNDMYFFPDLAGRAAVECGMRAVVGLIVVDFPTVWASSADEYVARGIRVHDEMREQPLVGTAWAPHAPYTVSDAPLLRLRTLAEEMDVPVHMHVHETAHEVEQAVAASGRRPLARLAELELLSPRLLAVHMTQLQAAEVDLVARFGVNVVHCPESNLKLASGLTPLEALRAAGVNLALGTDGAASNNDLDMFGEMRSAALLAKVVAGSASAMPASAALEMATLGGARALGLGELTGSIEVGKAADLVAVDLRAPATQPVYSAISALVYGASRDQVRYVWVAGRELLSEGEFTSLDLEPLLASAARWRDRLAAADAGNAG